MENKSKHIDIVLKHKAELALIIQILNTEKKAILWEEIDALEFIRLVKHHRLDSILFLKMTKQNIKAPKKLQARLEDINKGNKMRMMKLTAELIRIHKLFTENGIDYISLKGPALSQQIYGDYSIRSSRDLDILVRLEDFLKASNLLKSIGYENNKAFNSLNRFNYKEFYFKNKQLNILVELHHRLFNNQYLMPLEINAFKNKEIISINNNKIPVFDSGNNSQYIAIHAIVHKFQRMNWALDFLFFKPSLITNNAIELIKEYENYNLIDFVANSNEKELHLIKKMIYLLSLKSDIKYKLQELLQRLFIPYRFLDNL